MDNNQVYIHYGSDHFRPKMAKKAKNSRIPWTKPEHGTGLWGSRVDGSYGWKDWCENEDNEEWLEGGSFLFTLKPEANMVMLNNAADFEKLPEVDIFKLGLKESDFIRRTFYPDFEKCLEQGIDAIELGWYGDEWEDVKSDDLYMALYGWDCDCILVLNPDVIVPIEKGELK